MIQLRIQKESDLYNPYDPAQTRINEKVYLYLKSFCTELEYKNHLHDTLQIITDEPINDTIVEGNISSISDLIDGLSDD